MTNIEHAKKHGKRTTAAKYNDNFKYVLEALDLAGYGNLISLVKAAAVADEKIITSTTGMLAEWPRQRLRQGGTTDGDSKAEYKQRFGERLRHLMYEKGKTPAMMSRDLKISMGTISTWVTGKRLPRAITLNSICQYLDCSRSDLLSKDTPAAPVKPAPRPTTTLEENNAGKYTPLMVKRVVCSALQVGGYGHLQPIFLAAMDIRKKDIGIATKILKALAEDPDEDTEEKKEQNFQEAQICNEELYYEKKMEPEEDAKEDSAKGEE